MPLKDKEKDRIYHRELMRKRRAAQRAAGPARQPSQHDIFYRDWFRRTYGKDDPLHKQDHPELYK